MFSLSLLIPRIDLAPPWRPRPFGRGTQLHVGCHCELGQGELVRRLSFTKSSRLPWKSLQVFKALDSAVFFLELRSFAWFWILFSILILSGWSRKWPNLASRSQTSPFRSLWSHWVSIRLELTCWEETHNRVKQDNNQKETGKSFFWEPYEIANDERLFAGFCESLKMLRCWGCGAIGSSLIKLLQKFGSTARQVRMFISPCVRVLTLYRYSLYVYIVPYPSCEHSPQSLHFPWLEFSEIVTVASMPLIKDRIRPVRCNWIPSSVLVGSWKHKTKTQFYWKFRLSWPLDGHGCCFTQIQSLLTKASSAPASTMEHQKSPASLGRSQVTSKLRW